MELLTGEQRLRRAMNKAQTLADARSNIEQEIREAREAQQSEALHSVMDVSADFHNQAIQALTQRQQVISPLASRYGSVQVANLGPGVGGMAPVGGSASEIYLSADQVMHGAPEKLNEILVHETRHTNQVELKTGDGPVLITDTHEVKSDVVLLEGDTETHVIEATGLDRNDRPNAVYGEGKMIADQVKATHAGLWNSVLTQTGQVEDLQNAIWKENLEKGTVTTEEVMEQAEETGYNVNKKIEDWQNEQWVEGLEDESLTREDIEEESRKLDIEIQDSVEKKVDELMKETRALYENSPSSSNRMHYAVSA